ncbi:hypothetical protein ACP70R_042611 [Stipagrostis hirtigluma subsp. patula]
MLLRTPETTSCLMLPIQSSAKMQFRSQRRSDHRTAEDGGSKQVAFSTAKLEAPCEGSIHASMTYFPLNGPSPSFGSFLRPDVRDRLLEVGWGTKAPYTKDSAVPQEDYSKMFDDNGYYKFSGKRPRGSEACAATVEHSNPSDPEEDKNSAARRTQEKKNKKPEPSHTGGPLETVETMGSEQLPLSVPEVFTTGQVKGGPMENCACLNLSCVSAEEILTFLSELQNACVAIGMDFNLKPTIFVHFNCAVPSDVENTLCNAHGLITNQGIMRKQIGLLIVILPDFRDCDEKVEEICKNLGVVYQCCLPEHARTQILECNMRVDSGKEMGEDGESRILCWDNKMGDHRDTGEQSRLEDDSAGQLDESNEDGNWDEETGEAEGFEQLHDSYEDTSEDDCIEDHLDFGQLQIEQGIVSYWVCVNFSCMGGSQLFGYLAKLATTCKAIGMHFSWLPMDTHHVHSSVPHCIEDTLSHVHQDMQKKILEFSTKLGTKGEEGLLLVILPEDRDFDKKVKEVCKSLEVPYQCCLPKAAIKPSKLDLKETAREIQFQVVMRDTGIPFVTEAPTIIFGADISHCIQEVSESIACVVASVDWPNIRKYRSMVSHQPHDEVIIKNLFTENGGMVSNLLLPFLEKINRRPYRIIFFRHCVTESRLSHICEQEIEAIKRVVPLYTRDINHHSHLWLLGEGPGAGVQDPKIDFFYYHGLERTIRARYRVILDENHVTYDEFKLTITKLCIL